MSKDRILNRVMPFIYTFLMAVLFVCSSPKLSLAGDANISEFLACPGKIRSGYSYISAPLSGLLRLCNRIVNANWWSLFSLLMILLGTYAIMWFIGRKLESHHIVIRIMASVLMFVLLWECMFKNEVNFTHTATMAAVAALVLLSDTVDDKERFGKRNVRSVIRAVAVILLLILAMSIREDLTPVIIAFPVLILAYRLVVPFEADDIIGSIKGSVKNRKRILFFAGVVVLAVFLFKMMTIVVYQYDKGISLWQKSDDNRAYICDYPERYKSYEDDSEIYDELGIKPSWLNMVMSYITSDAEHFSPGQLQKMIDLRGPSKFKISDFTDSLKDKEMLWIAVLSIAVLTLWLGGSKRVLLPLLTSIFVFGCFGVYCVIIGRIEWRVTAACLVLLVVSFIAMSVDGDMPVRTVDLSARICLTVLLMMLVVAEGRFVVEETGGLMLPGADRIVDKDQAELLEQINSDKENAYLYVDMARFSTAYDMWASHAPDYLDNYFPLTATFISGCSDRLRDYGIDNAYTVYRDMLDRPNIRAVYCQAMTYVIYDYLMDYYDPNIGISSVAKYGKYDIIRFLRSKPATTKGETEITAAANGVPGPDEDYKVRFAADVCCIIPADKMAQYVDYTVNMTDTYSGDVYSYGMEHDDARIYGTIWCMNDSWSPSVTVATLNGIDADGNVVELGDITSAFSDILGPQPEEAEEAGQ